MYIYHHAYVHALKMLSISTSIFFIFHLKNLYVSIWFINCMHAYSITIFICIPYQLPSVFIEITAPIYSYICRYSYILGYLRPVSYLLSQYSVHETLLCVLFCVLGRPWTVPKIPTCKPVPTKTYTCRILLLTVTNRNMCITYLYHFYSHTIHHELSII